MKIKFMFDDWHTKNGRFVYNWREDLYSRIFHTETTPNGEIGLNDQDEAGLEKHPRGGFRSVSWIMLKKD